MIEKRFFLMIMCLFIFIIGINAQNINTAISLPEGFSIDMYTDQVPGARTIRMSDNGTLFVSTREIGKVYAVKDTDGNNTGDKVYTIASGLNMPNGIDLKDGDLYVAEVQRLIRFNNIEQNLENPPEPEKVYTDLPRYSDHGWRYIGFGPQGNLHIAIGAPCNVCLRENEIFASIAKFNSDYNNLTVIAHGIRNSVGFDWHPNSGKLWFTDNGRDYLGDNRPPDELNKLSREGQHFGFPYLHGKTVWDPQFGNQGKDKSFTKPAIELGPHVAALGMEFYDGDMFPEKYRGSVFIAEHGSWNRSVPIGYRISFVKVEENEAKKYSTFAEGWLRGANAWGRPVDVEVLNDGSLLVSDDRRGAVYRITYSGE